MSCRAFLIHTEAFHVDVVDELLRRGVDIRLVCSSKRKGLLDPLRARLPNARVVSSFDAQGGRVPEGGGQPGPAAATDLERLAPFEMDVLHMIDRLNLAERPFSDVRSLYVRLVGVWAHVLDEEKPDLVVFQGTPHMGFDYVLYLLARSRGVTVRVVDRTYIDDRLLLLDDFRDVPGPTSAEITKLSGQALPLERERTQLDELNASFNDIAGIERHLSFLTIARGVVNRKLPQSLFKRAESSVNSVTLKEPREIVIRLLETRERLRARRGYARYRSLAHAAAQDRHYVFFPLHFQPERSTLPGGGRFVDQLYALESLSAALPADWRILVKEHPRQFRRGILWSKARSDEFYERLAAIPHVGLVPLATSSESLIRGARAVATITGTGGWEAVQLGKPAIVFGTPWYLRAPGVLPVSSTESCRAQLAKVADGFAPDVQAVAAYVRLMTERYTFEGAFSDKLLAKSRLTSVENAASYADAIAGEQAAVEGARA